jgi:hypothetical protein
MNQIKCAPKHVYDFVPDWMFYNISLQNLEGFYEAIHHLASHCKL